MDDLIETAVARGTEPLVREVRRLRAQLARGVPERLAYSVREVAEVLALSEATVRRLITDGHLRAFLPDGLDRKMLVSVKDVHEWIDAQQEAVPVQPS